MNEQPLKPISRRTVTFPLSASGDSVALLLTDARKLDVELFGKIEYLSEIEDLGLKRIGQINQENATHENWKQFQSFVRQAKLFYFSACEQEPLVSPLNLFYSFLNLVKAYCSLYDPDKLRDKIGHGICISGGIFYDVSKQDIKFKCPKESRKKEPELMALFYQLVTKEEIRETFCVNAAKLLSYCGDINYEFEKCVAGAEFKIFPTKTVIAGEDDSKMRVVLAVMGLEALLKNKKVRDIIEKNFDLVKLSPEQAVSTFDIHLNEYRAYSFLQGKDEFSLTPISFVSSDYYQRFFPFATFDPRTPDKGSMLNLPILDTNNNEVLFNECLSIFVLMFYMSELVRYNPLVIQENLSKPQGWLMERFVINTHQTFLRYMVNLITGEDLILYF